MKINQSFLYGMGSGLILASIFFGASSLLETSSQPQVSPLTQPASSQPAQQPPEQKQQVQPPAQQPAPTKVKVEITEGMDATQIAQLLVKNGVIADAESFLKTAGDRVSSIRTGTYELPLAGDPEQIIALITKK